MSTPGSPLAGLDRRDRFRAARRGAVFLLVGVLSLHCSGDGPNIPLPDLSGAGSEIVMAVTQARDEVRSDSGSGERWGALGDRYMAHGWRREAATCYEQASRLEDARFDWPYLLGHALSLRDLGGAREAFERAVAIDGAYLPARIHLAQTLVRLGLVDEARRQFNQALSRDPDNLDALLGISQLDLDTGRHEQARARLEQAYRIDPEPSELHDALAQVYLIAGENELAREFATSAATAPPRRTMADPRRERALPQAASSRGLP
jgi:tetratricopeptide (TPR) repeat protein